MHVSSTYSSVAHYWLIHQMVNADKWRLISDEDGSLMTALYRVFAKEVREGNAHHFLCKVDRSKTKQEAFMEYKNGREFLKRWGHSIGEPKATLSALAKMKLEDELQTHKLCELVNDGGSSYYKWAKKPLEHPLPTVDKGYYTIDCTTDISKYKPKDLVEMARATSTQTSIQSMLSMLLLF